MRPPRPPILGCCGTTAVSALPHHAGQTVLHSSVKCLVDRFDETDIVAGPRFSMSVLYGRGV